MRHLRLKRIKGGDKLFGISVSIGVFGAGRGVGTTHFALMLANYYANVLRLKTAVIEYNGHNDFMKICDETSERIEDIRHFCYKGIEFYHCDSQNSVSKVLLSGYQVYIFDLGESKEEYFEQFIKCDVRIVVCGTDLWKLASAKAILEKVEGISVCVACFMADCKLSDALGRKFKRVIIDLPIDKNPFRLQSQNILWIDKFLKGVK